MGDLGDQSVSVTAIEDASDLGTLAAGIVDVFQMRRILELVSDIGIGESTDHVLAVEQSAEDLSFIAGERIKSFCRSFWSYLLTGRDAIQGADRVGWIVDFSKSRPITAVGSPSETSR